VKLAASLGLPVTGIDLMTTADGDFFCLEVNLGLAFSYY
jgi:D-alanine-D-alanine ligase-like ATP-grasp enzyme